MWSVSLIIYKNYISLNTIYNTLFTIERIILKRSAHQKPFTLNPGTISETKSISSAFITKVNNPNVMIFIGRVSKIMNGFMKKFTIHKTIATTSALKNPDTTTHGSIYAVNKTDTALITILRIVHI